MWQLYRPFLPPHLQTTSHHAPTASFGSVADTPTREGGGSPTCTQGQLKLIDEHHQVADTVRTRSLAPFDSSILAPTILLPRKLDPLMHGFGLASSHAVHEMITTSGGLNRLLGYCHNLKIDASKLNIDPLENTQSLISFSV